MSAQHVAVHIHEIALGVIFAGVFFNEIRVAAVLDKADILAVMLSGVDEILLLGNLSGFRLVHGAQRENGMGKLLLGHGIQYIALVLGRVQSLF